MVASLVFGATESHWVASQLVNYVRMVSVKSTLAAFLIVSTLSAQLKLHLSV